MDYLRHHEDDHEGDDHDMDETSCPMIMTVDIE